MYILSELVVIFTLYSDTENGKKKNCKSIIMTSIACCLCLIRDRPLFNAIMHA